MTSSTVKLLMAAGIAGAAMPQNLFAKEIILEGGDNAAVAVSIYNNDLAFCTRQPYRSFECRTQFGGF